jgi:DNA-binding transcriptional regulator LsrR (DeoR family)
LASVERAMRLQRRSVNRLLRDLEERGILDIRQRDFASNKVGAS